MQMSYDYYDDSDDDDDDDDYNDDYNDDNDDKNDDDNNAAALKGVVVSGNFRNFVHYSCQLN